MSKDQNPKENGRLERVFRRFYYGHIREDNSQDHYHQWLLRLIAFSVVVLIAFIIFVLLYKSRPAFDEFGISFLTSSSWDPIEENYGAWVFIVGTVLTSLLALAIAAPFSIGAALFLTEICSPKIRSILSFIIEILAAIPSIVYGLWALFVLAPLVQDPLAIWIEHFFSSCHLSACRFFQASQIGLGVFTAGLILAIMITPIITSLCTEVFKKMSRLQKEGALALGATRWETIKIAVLRPGVPGILGAVILGLGRAFGETMAVAMVIGNQPEIPSSLFAPASSMAAIIANEYPEATGDIHLGALTYIGLALFLVSLLINILSRFIAHRVTRGVSFS